MNDALHESPLQRFWKKLHSLYLGSLCCAILTAIGHAWLDSWCCQTLCRLLDRAPDQETSRLHRWLLRVNRFVETRFHRLAELVQESLCCRIYRAVFRTFRNSRILGWFFAGGTTGLILLLIGCYIPLDWLLRDVFSIPVLSSLWDELLMLGSIAWLFYQRAGHRHRLPVSDTPMDMPVLFFLATCLLLLGFRFEVPAINIAGLRATVQYILWFFIVTRLLRDDQDFLRLYGVMVVIASAVGLHGVYQYIVGAPMPAGWVDQAEASVRTRVYSIFSSCNIMGDYMVLFAPMAAGVAYSVKNKWLKLIAWGCTLVMCLSCLLTMSRGAWIAMIVAILIFAILVDLRLLVLLAAAGMVALCLPFVKSRIGYLLTDAYSRSANRGGRSVRWEQAIGYLFDVNPLLGMGFGRFGGAIAMQNQTSLILDYFYTDNYYVKILTENGIMGLFSYLVMQLCLLWTGLKAWFRTRKHAAHLSPLCAGMLAGMAGVLVHCIFENIFEEPYMMATYWTVAAMTMYAGFLRNREIR